MSYQIDPEILQDPYTACVGNVAGKSLLMEMVRQADDDGVCRRSITELAAVCELGLSTVRKWILVLEIKEMIHRPHRDPGPTKIYLIKDRASGFVKIGQSYDPEHRLRRLTAQSTLLPAAHDFELLYSWEAPGSVEAELHRFYALKRIRGEWFDLTEADIADIKSLGRVGGSL